MRNYILLLITLCLIGCNEDSNPVAEKTADSTVYIAWRDGYWKNGVKTILSNGSSEVDDMWVDGSSVWVAGKVYGGVTQNVIWKDGEEKLKVEGSGGGITLVASYESNLFGVWYQGGWVLYKNGTTSPIASGWVTDLSILKDDAYLAGNSQGSEYLWNESDFYPLDTYAQCWKNDQLIFKEKVNSYANTIFIHENDIYLGGHLNHYPSLDRVACYWKNGIRFSLTREDQDAEVNALFITSDHVYAAGTINDRAVYWKDGVVTYLSGTGSSKGNSIAVLGTDVYVAGRENKYPAVWKNGVKQTLPDQEKQGEIKTIVAVSNSVNEKQN